MSSPQTIDLAEAYRRLAKRHADLLIVADVLEEQLVQSRQQLVDLSARLTGLERATATPQTPDEPSPDWLSPDRYQRHGAPVLCEADA